MAPDSVGPGWREIVVHIYPGPKGGRWVLRTRRHRGDWHWDRHLGSGDVAAAGDDSVSRTVGILRAVSDALAVAADRMDR